MAVLLEDLIARDDIHPLNREDGLEPDLAVQHIVDLTPDTDLTELEPGTLCVVDENSSLPEVENLWEELANRQVVGLLFSGEELSGASKEAAEKNSLVLLQADTEQNWSEFLSSQLDISWQKLFAYSQKLQQEFSELLLNDEGMRTICELLSSKIGRKVLVLDRFREDLLYKDRSLIEDDRYGVDILEKRSLIDEKRLYSAQGYTIKRIRYKFEEQLYTELQIKLWEANGSTLGYLTVVENENNTDIFDYISLIQAASTLALKLHYNHFVRDLVLKTCNQLVLDLLEGKDVNEEVLIRQGEFAGWDLSLSYQVYVLRIFSDDETEIETGDYLLSDYRDRVMQRLYQIMQTNYKMRYIIFDYEDDILLLVHLEDDDNRRQLAVEISSELNSKLKKFRILIGGAQKSRHCKKLRNSYREAVKALRVLEQSGIEEDILFFEDTGILQILWNDDHNQLMNFAYNQLEGLLSYDEKHNTNWLETLGVYLKTDGSVKETAQKLHFHPNTISYRINRIGNILDCSLDDFETKLNLSIAYKIYKYISPADNSSEPEMHEQVDEA